jgi:hypothetical protein
MSNLARVAARFEIAVGNFVRSAFDLAANEKAFQAWYAASVIQEFHHPSDARTRLWIAGGGSE